MRLNNKIVLVTGAAGSIGSAITERFIQEGAKVAAVDLHLPGSDADNFTCNLASSDDIDATCEQIRSKVGSPDIVVHCAAASELAACEETEQDNFQTIMAVNVYALMRLARNFAPSMCNKNNGAFLAVSSITGHVGAPGMATYSASKGALHTATRTLALELAKNNIRVNSISPASIDTPMLRDKFARQADPVAARAQNISRHPLNRLGEPHEVANLALFLASDEAAWITGADYIIDGGASIYRP